MKVAQSAFTFVILCICVVQISCLSANKANPEAFSGTLSWHTDSTLTGQNTKETILTPANVNQNKFGKVFSYSLDGQTYTQPLYVSDVSIPGQGKKNVIYVGTANDTVYAFDADGGSSSPLWSVNFTDSSAGITTVPATEVSGIIGTPVIDGHSGTLYVVAATRNSNKGSFAHHLHALDIHAGKEKFGGPIVIQASVPGTGAGSVNGQVAFQSQYQLQRSSLLLVNGVVYVAFASYGDMGPYHGWLLGYDTATLKQVSAWNATPDGEKGGIWLSGASPSADAKGNIFVVIGNGTFDADGGGRDYGDSVVKLTPDDDKLKVSDSFTPFDCENLEASDIDLGASGFTILPEQPGAVPHLGVTTGKAGKIYLLNRDNLGKYQHLSDSQIVQSIPNAVGTQPANEDHSTAVYWQGNVYYVGNGDVIKQFQLAKGNLSAAPVSQGAHFYNYPGANMSVSSNGSQDGILWALESSGVLRAYDATDVSRELYNSDQAPNARDQFGPATRFGVPTVVNGRVYVNGQTQMAVFGLLP
jgi:hypothetical protein